MPSAAEPTLLPTSPSPARSQVSLERWNRRLHYLSGLFLMFFLWLFAFSGLLLNHPSWTFHEHWKNRAETTTQRAIAAPPSQAVSDLAQAQDIMSQLHIEGDILWTTARANPGSLEFQVRRPGHFFFINADWAQGKATVRQADVNIWGTMKFLHVSTGNVAGDPRNQRDWWLTYIWAYSMDIVALGLVFMVLSSIYMWYQLPQKRGLGIIILGLGCISCGFFCWELRWFA